MRQKIPNFLRFRKSQVKYNTYFYKETWVWELKSSVACSWRCDFTSSVLDMVQYDRHFSIFNSTAQKCKARQQTIHLGLTAFLETVAPFPTPPHPQNPYSATVRYAAHIPEQKPRTWRVILLFLPKIIPLPQNLPQRQHITDCTHQPQKDARFPTTL